MAENPFTQFQSDAPGVEPPVDASGNPFPQFQGGGGPVTPAQLPQPWTLSEALRPWTSQIPGLVRKGIETVRQGGQNVEQSVYGNVMSGAEQQATPHPERYGPPVASGKNLQINDAGEVSYYDDDGTLVPTDRSKHVLLNGPEGPTLYARTPETTESPAVGASRVLSLGLGAGQPAQVAKVPRMVTQARPVTAVPPSIPKLKAAATGVYNSDEILARPVDMGAVGAAFQDIVPQLRKLDPEVQQRLVNVLGGLGERGVTVGDLDNASTRLGYIADETNMTARGPVSTEAAVGAKLLKDKIDALQRSIAPEFATADKNYGAAMAAQTIVNRGEKASVLARGGDMAARMQTQATQLLANPKWIRGFTPDEVNMLREMSEGRVPGDRLRQLAGWMSGKIAAIGPLAGAALGYKQAGLTGGLIGATATAALEGGINKVLTSLGNRATAAQINRLSEAIRSRSPLAAELTQKASDWDAAWSALKGTPTSQTLTNLARASRELSNSMRAVGVDVRPDTLMRGVEGPGTGKAQEDQQ